MGAHIAASEVAPEAPIEWLEVATGRTLRISSAQGIGSEVSQLLNSIESARVSRDKALLSASALSPLGRVNKRPLAPQDA